jgi:hypothetical protein
MAKAVYLGHNKMPNQYYVNDRGQNVMDRNVAFICPDNDLQAVVKHLAAEYKDRKAVLKTDLPEEKVSELQRLVEQNKALRKMTIE